MRRKLSAIAGPERGCIRLSVVVRFTVEDDSAALGADAAIGGLEQSHNAKAEAPIADRCLLSADAIGEVRHDAAEGFARFNLWAVDVSAAVVDQQAAALLKRLWRGGRLADIDPLVVDLDGLGGVELIENQAAARSSEDHLSDLDGREPVDVDVRQQRS